MASAREPQVTVWALVTGDSIDLGSAAPILALTNNRNCLNCLHIEKIAIDADQQCAFTGNGSAQHWYVGRTAQVWRQIGGLYNNADSAKESADLISIAPRKIEFLDEFSPQFLEGAARPAPNSSVRFD